MPHPITSRLSFRIVEILLVFAIPLGFILLMIPMAGENPLFIQGIVWIGNVLMLLLIWTGMKLRGENWSVFGLNILPKTWKETLRFFLLSLLVFVLAMLGFLIGSVIMANITGIPENADMSGYNYMQGNIGMLLLSLTGVYIVSSFGEEVVYRGFLITRISQLGFDEKTGKILAVIVSSVIFGLAHYSWGIVGIVQTTFMGLALAICFLKLKRRLWILILAHAYMDTILMLQMYLAGN